MTISDRDFAYLHKVSVTIDGFEPKPAASMGVTRVHLQGGEELFWRSKALQIKFRDPNHPKRADWEWVQCHLSEEKVMGSGGIPRLRPLCSLQGYSSLEIWPKRGDQPQATRSGLVLFVAPMLSSHNV